MDSTHWADCWKVHEACAVSRRALAARPCTCHLCPPGIGCAPCWARETLGELIDGYPEAGTAFRGPAPAVAEGTFRPPPGTSLVANEDRTESDQSDGHAFVPDDLGDHGWPSYTCAVCGKRKAEHSDGEAS